MASLIRDGRNRSGRTLHYLLDHHIPLRLASALDPRKRGRRGGHGNPYRGAQALRFSYLRGTAGNRGWLLRALREPHRAPRDLSADHNRYYDRHVSVRRQGNNLRPRPRRHATFALPGRGLGEISLPSRSDLRRDHRLRHPSDAKGHLGSSAATLSAPQDRLMPSDPILDVRGASKRFGGVTAVQRCSLAVERGKIVALVGPNGSGKTTLFNLITGVERIDEGEIFFKGDRIDHLPPHKIARRGIGRTFQLIRVFPELTALENLLVVARQDWEPAYRRALELLTFVKLDQLRGEFAGNLSYGQQRLLEFARVLMIDPDLVLLDEPAAGINRSLLNDLLNAIRDLRAGGKTVLIVEHDMKVVMDLSEKIFVLDHGEKLTEGAPATVLKDERVMEAYVGR